MPIEVDEIENAVDVDLHHVAMFNNRPSVTDHERATSNIAQLKKSISDSTDSYSQDQDQD